MAKKNTKISKNSNKPKEDELTKSITNENSINKANPEFLAPQNSDDLKTMSDCLENKKTLSSLDISDLAALEKACSLLCRRFETTARLDNNNSIKFKEYKQYYEIIFSELEKKVLEYCVKN